VGQKTIAKLMREDVPPEAMAASVIRMLVNEALDMKNPASLRIDAGSRVLPFIAPRLQVIAQTTRHVGSYDDCRTQDELFARVEQDLGGYWATLLRKAVQSDDPGAVIDAEVVEPAAAELGPKREPEPAG
jgi:hypothetical protein